MNDYINGLRACVEELTAQQETIQDIATMMRDAYDRGSKVYIMGNGGSATTASHFARDLKIGAQGRNKIMVESLSDNIAVITSIGNDISYDEIFAEQLKGQAVQDDVVIAISCSGKSPNITRGIHIAKALGVKTVGILGFGGGTVLGMCSKAVVFQSTEYMQCEDIHLAVCHILTKLVKRRIRNE